MTGYDIYSNCNDNNNQLRQTSHAKKTTLSQRNLLIAPLERLFRRVQEDINDIKTNYNIADSETEMKNILSNLEDSTTYLVDHPSEHATAEDLINRFTDIQDKHDDIMDELRQMLQKNTAETTTHSKTLMPRQFKPPTHLIQCNNSQYYIGTLARHQQNPAAAISSAHQLSKQ